MLFRSGPYPDACNFYPRPPRGGRLASPVQPRRMVGNFYPRPPRGGRPLMIAPPKSQSGYFYPRPPRGGRPSRCCGTRSSTRFLSTPSARRATCWPPPPCLRPVISIHALREEGDSLLPPRPAACPNFYPRPPRGGRPFPDSSGTLRWPYFYPRPPRGGRRTCGRPRA